MSSKILMGSLGVAAALATGVALAAGTGVVTRSVADANADLMRTYTAPGGPTAGEIRNRSTDDCYADLMRDWDGTLTKGQIVGVGSIKPVLGTVDARTEQLGRK